MFQRCTGGHVDQMTDLSPSDSIRPVRSQLLARSLGIGAAFLLTIAAVGCSNDDTTYPDEPFSDVDSSVPAADGAADGVDDGTEDGTGPAIGSDIDGDGTNSEVPAEAEN